MGTRKSQGFTLIELLVVIGIITLLAAILFTVTSSSRESARQKSCMANLMSIANALRQYHDDYGAYPPPPNGAVGGSYVNAAGPPPLVTGLGLFALLVEGKIDGVKSFRCPDDDNPAAFNVNTGVGATSYNEYYNYFGYYDTGPSTNGNSIVTLADAQAVYNGKSDQQGRVMWDPNGPTSVFPGLYNRRAPDNTIITHCAYHRQFFRQNAEIDVVVRLDGSAQAVKRNGTTTATTTDIWVRQTPQ